MKTFSANLSAHYALNLHTIATCMKVTRTDATVYGFTDVDEELVVSGVTYKPGFELSALSSTASLAVDNLELTILPNEAVYPLSAILAGKWVGAAFEVFEVNKKDLAGGVNILKKGLIGEFKKRRSSYVVEFRSFLQALQPQQGIVTTPTCRARLFDSKCLVNPAGFTFTGSVTSLTDNRIFSDSLIAGVGDDYFKEGLITFNTGNNATYSQKIKMFTGGQFTLSLPMPFAVQVGDTYTAKAGCQKRLAEDCKTKFNNVLNFQGEPHLPGQDKLTSPGSAPAQPAATPTLPPSTDYTGSGP